MKNCCKEGSLSFFILHLNLFFVDLINQFVEIQTVFRCKVDKIDFKAHFLKNKFNVNDGSIYRSKHVLLNKFIYFLF